MPTYRSAASFVLNFERNLRLFLWLGFLFLVLSFLTIVWVRHVLGIETIEDHLLSVHEENVSGFQTFHFNLTLPTKNSEQWTRGIQIIADVRRIIEKDYPDIEVSNDLGVQSTFAEFLDTSHDAHETLKTFLSERNLTKLEADWKELETIKRELKAAMFRSFYFVSSASESAGGVLWNKIVCSNGDDLPREGSAKLAITVNGMPGPWQQHSTSGPKERATNGNYSLEGKDHDVVIVDVPIRNAKPVRSFSPDTDHEIQVNHVEIELIQWLSQQAEADNDLLTLGKMVRSGMTKCSLDVVVAAYDAKFSPGSIDLHLLEYITWMAGALGIRP